MSLHMFHPRCIRYARISPFAALTGFTRDDLREMLAYYRANAGFDFDEDAVPASLSPEALAPRVESVLRGVPMEIIRSDVQQLVCQSGIQGLQKASTTDRATDGDFESEFFIHSADDQALYLCRKPIDGIARARVTVTRTDSARAESRT